MTFSEASFRDLYHRFVVFPFTEKEKGFPGTEHADFVLAYSYPDSMCGLSFEALELGQRTGDGFIFSGGCEEISAKFRFDAVRDLDFQYPDQEDELREKHTRKIETIHRFYAAEPGVEKTRDLTVLDEFRYPDCPDDVQVLLLKDGIRPEACWVRLTSVKTRLFTGKLLNEPYADFGFHEGDEVKFVCAATRDGRKILVMQ